MVVLMKECGLATIWRVWATNAFRGPRPVPWGQNILMLTGVQKTIIIVIIIKGARYNNEPRTKEC